MTVLTLSPLVKVLSMDSSFMRLTFTSANSFTMQATTLSVSSESFKRHSKMRSRKHMTNMSWLVFSVGPISKLPHA